MLDSIIFIQVILIVPSPSPQSDFTPMLQDIDAQRTKKQSSTRLQSGRMSELQSGQARIFWKKCI